MLNKLCFSVILIINCSAVLAQGVEGLGRGLGLSEHSYERDTFETNEFKGLSSGVRYGQLTYSDTDYVSENARVILNFGRLNSDKLSLGIDIDSYGGKGVMTPTPWLKLYAGGTHELDLDLAYRSAVPNHLKMAVGGEAGVALQINNVLLVKAGGLSQGELNFRANDNDYAALMTGSRIELAFLDKILVSASTLKNYTDNLRAGTKLEEQKGSIFIQIIKDSNGNSVLGLSGDFSVVESRKPTNNLVPTDYNDGYEDAKAVKTNFSIEGKF